MTKRQMQAVIRQDDIQMEIMQKIRLQFMEPEESGKELCVYWDPNLDRLTYSYGEPEDGRILLNIIQPGTGFRTTSVIEHCFWELQGNDLYFDRGKIYNFISIVVDLGVKKQANLKTVLKECKAKKIDLSVFDGHDIEEVLDICCDVIDCDLSYYIEEDWERFYDFCGDEYERQQKKQKGA